MRTLVLGVDSGTQSTKVLVVDARLGKVLSSASESYDLIPNLPPGAKEQHPQDWINATAKAVKQALRAAKASAAEVKAIGVSGQQHGFVPLDKSGAVIRPAKLWCDTATAPECEEIMRKLGGFKQTIQKQGLAVLPGFTASKILWLKKHEPKNFAKLATVLLPHDYLNYWLTGQKSMEFGDASGMALLDVLKGISPQPFYLVGLIDDDPNKIGLKLNDYPVLCGSSCLLQMIEDEAITDLILAITGEMNGTMFQAILDAQEHGIEITTMPVVYEDLLGRVPIFLLETDWIIRNFVDQARTSFFYEMGKRLMDLVGSLVGILVIIPFLPFVVAAIAIDSGFPVFFFQYRLGKSGKLYQIIKFRTMSQDAEKDGVVRITTENDSRITRVGWFLRKTHLDEWPQFINVLRGEMSLVGPRAERSELVHELQQKIPFYRARLLIKPGITGWAQINFGYAATVEDTAIKLEYDLYYIKHRNLITDVVILLRTFGSVVGFRGQ